jgi:hypothetical protein
MRISDLAKLAKKWIGEGREREPIAAFVMTAERVREITECPAMTDQQASEILHDLQLNWGDPPIDDQLVEGVLTLHSMR